jgi:membrane-bound lytic murein transglycosylase MltF
MKTALTAILISICSQALAIDSNMLDAVAMIESSRNPKAVGDSGKARGEFQMHKAAWDQISADRKRNGLPVYDWSYAHSESIAREYAQAYLTWVETRLEKNLSRKPAPWEIYAAYNRGVKGFLDTKGNFSMLPKHTQRACSRLSNLLIQSSTKKP